MTGEVWQSPHAYGIGITTTYATAHEFRGALCLNRTNSSRIGRSPFLRCTCRTRQNLGASLLNSGENAGCPDFAPIPARRLRRPANVCLQENQAVGAEYIDAYLVDRHQTH